MTRGKRATGFRPAPPTAPPGGPAPTPPPGSRSHLAQAIRAYFRQRQAPAGPPPKRGGRRAAELRAAWDWARRHGAQGPPQFCARCGIDVFGNPKTTLLCSVVVVKTQEVDQLDVLCDCGEVTPMPTPDFWTAVCGPEQAWPVRVWQALRRLDLTDWVWIGAVFAVNALARWIAGSVPPVGALWTHYGWPVVLSVLLVGGVGYALWLLWRAVGRYTPWWGLGVWFVILMLWQVLKRLWAIALYNGGQ